MTSSYSGDHKHYDDCRNADLIDALADIAHEQEEAMRESDSTDSWMGVDDADDKPLTW